MNDRSNVVVYTLIIVALALVAVVVVLDQTHDMAKFFMY